MLFCHSAECLLKTTPVIYEYLLDFLKVFLGGRQSHKPEDLHHRSPF